MRHDLRFAKTFFILGALLAFTPPVKPAGATMPVQREMDCRLDKACIDKYREEKAAWLDCMQKAGLSEKKIRKLEMKVESAGIHALKRQEFLTFNSARKDCHKHFQEALSGLKAERNIQKKTLEKDEKGKSESGLEMDGKH